MKQRKIWVFTIWLVLLPFLLSACGLTDVITGAITDVKDRVEEELAATDEVDMPDVPLVEMPDQSFAPYAKPEVQLPDQFTGGYSLPLSANEVKGLNDEMLNLTATQKQALLENGFVVVPPKDDPNAIYYEFYQAYESYRYSSVPVFVTTDSIFHVYHLIFDKMLRDLERNAFIPLFEELTTAMLQTSIQQYEELAGTELEEAALRNTAYFTVSAKLLGLTVDVPQQALDLADQEIALMDAKAVRTVSPIWTMGGEGENDLLYEDYSQYIPRGHYTRSEELKKYFMAMMWYGRMTYRLQSTVETQRALLMIQAIRDAQTSSGRSAEELWQNIYDPTVFIVGKADDLSFHEYGLISDQVFVFPLI